MSILHNMPVLPYTNWAWKIDRHYASEKLVVQLVREVSRQRFFTHTLFHGYQQTRTPDALIPGWFEEEGWFRVHGEDNLYMKVTHTFDVLNEVDLVDPDEESIRLAVESIINQRNRVEHFAQLRAERLAQAERLTGVFKPKPSVQKINRKTARVQDARD